MTRTIPRRPHSRRIPWASCIILICALLAACGSTSQREPLSPEDEIRQKITAAYEAQVTSDRPSHVVLTYPTTISALPADKRREYQILRRVLQRQDIPFESKPIDQVLVEVPRSESSRRTFHAYDLDEELARTIRGGKMLIVSLDTGRLPKTYRHPLSVEYDVTVASLHDPIRVR